MFEIKKVAPYRKRPLECVWGLLTAAATATAVVAATTVVSTATAADDKDKYNYETAIVSTKKVITHVWIPPFNVYTNILLSRIKIGYKLILGIDFSAEFCNI